MPAALSQSNAASKRRDTEPPEQHSFCPTQKAWTDYMTASAQTSKFESTSFSSLPFELREQIWLYTLPPRLIFLHPSEVYPPSTDDAEFLEHQDSLLSDHASRTASILFNYSVYSQGTTPAEAFALYAKETIASLEMKKNSQPDSTPGEWDLKDLNNESPEPPAALNVCRESRQVAIRKGYVLAFKPVCLKMKGIKSERKGIWVDFERDTIMFNTIRQHELPQPRAELYDFLRLLMEFDPEDAALIKNLALRGNLISVLETLRACGQWVTKGEISEWQRFSGYRNLKHIWVDDEFHYDSHERYRPHSQTGTPSPLFKGNERAIEDFLKARLVRSDRYANPPVWPWGIPSFKVIRGVAWKDYF
ncbi:MAG: hypothetical protein CL912_21530 [Deltaproteobacteria bacterium]|nr:hypothetical protein [Deltaproteobacteria bacterium]